MTDPDTLDASNPRYTLVSQVYHTVDHADEHPEGDEYIVTDLDLARTLIAIGFADVAPPKA